jgi:hypothetical protein
MLPQLGLELQPLGRPVRSQSQYRLIRHRGAKLSQNLTDLNIN